MKKRIILVMAFLTIFLTGCKKTTGQRICVIGREEYFGSTTVKIDWNKDDEYFMVDYKTDSDNSLFGFLVVINQKHIYDFSYYNVTKDEYFEYNDKIYPYFSGNTVFIISYKNSEEDVKENINASRFHIEAFGNEFIHESELPNEGLNNR